jgi:hypothetical protein
MTGSPTRLQARRIGVAIMWIGAVLIALWALIATARAYAAARSLADHEAAFDLLAEQGISTADPAATTELILAVRRDVEQLHQAAGPLVTVAPALGWLPRFGPLLRNGPQLMTIADAGTEAAAAAAPTLEALMTLLQSGDAQSGVTASVAHILADGSPALALALSRLEEVEKARSEVQGGADLPWRVQALLERMDAELPLALDSLRLALILPDVMAVGGTRSYLIVAQNEDEIRPTGGYFSGAGLLQLQEGRIVSLDFLDAGLVDDWQNKAYDSPPAPLETLMGAELFMFRDANFWPDFGRSAREAIRLYRLGQDREVDGLITIDQIFLQRLLEVIGPVQVASVDEVIRASNVIEQIRLQWEPGSQDFFEWMENRKSFMGPLASAMLARIEGGIAGIDPVYLLRTVHAAAEERHLQLYLIDPVAQASVTKVGWDNRQHNTAGADFLQVIDTNVGFNKANASVSRSTVYRVTLADSAVSTARLSVEYVNAAGPEPPGCRPQTTYTVELRYRDLVSDCYWNYLRIYAPGGSRLLDASRHPVAGDLLVTGKALDGQVRQDTDLSSGLVVFSNFLLVPRSETVRAEIVYALPQSIQVVEDGQVLYRLLVKKQAGMMAEPLRLEVALPPGREFVKATPQPNSVSGTVVVWNLSLQTDVAIALSYR